MALLSGPATFPYTPSAMMTAMTMSTRPQKSCSLPANARFSSPVACSRRVDLVPGAFGSSL